MESDCLVGRGFLCGFINILIKIFPKKIIVMVSYIGNILNTNELHTLKWEILCYI